MSKSRYDRRFLNRAIEKIAERAKEEFDERGSGLTLVKAYENAKSMTKSFSETDFLHDPDIAIGESVAAAIEILLALSVVEAGLDEFLLKGKTNGC